MSLPPDARASKVSNWATRFRKSLAKPARPVTLGVLALEDRVTPATLHWLGAAGANGNLWSAPANWQEGRVPATGDRLSFDTTYPGFSASANGFAPTNDVAGLTKIAFDLLDASSAGDFAVGGLAVGLAVTPGPAVTSTVSDGKAAVVTNPLTLATDSVVSVGLGALTLGGPIGGAFRLNAVGSPASTLTLGGANTFTGGVVVTSGTVSAGTATAFGTAPFVLFGGTLSATSSVNLPNAFTVAAPSTIGGGGIYTLSGNGNLLAPLTLAQTGSLTLSGALSGPAGLIETGFPGGTTLGGTAPNTFAGGTVIVYGGVTLQKPPGVTALASPVTITGSFATLTLGASNQLNGTPVSLGKGSSFQLGGFSDTVTSLTGLGSLDTSATAAATLTVTGGGNQLLTGALTGFGALTYAGSGTLTLAGPSAPYVGSLTAASGVLAVSADFSGAAAKVTGGTLSGTGVLKSVTATGGFVDLGTPGSGGTLNTANGANASSLTGATFRADLAPRGPSDQLALGANATIVLTGSKLSANALTGTLAESYTLVTSPTGGISGQFTGLPEAATVTAGSQSFRINYTSNAVTLTNLGVGSRVRHWIGAVSSLFSAPGNWAENSAPASGDTLIFDTSTAGFAGTAAAYAPSADLGGLSDLSLVINDNSAGGDFAIGGTALGLSNAAGVALSSTVAVGKGAAVANALSLGADTTVAVGLGTLALNGVVGGGFALAAAGSPAGTLVLGNANSYSRGTVITSGTVAVGADRSLGFGGVTLNGGTLAEAVSFLNVPNPFVVTAPSAIGGGGFFNLTGAGVLNADLRLIDTGFLELNGALSGPGSLIQDSFPGGTTLGGTAANTYTGPTYLQSGELKLKKTPGTNAVASPILLAGGSSPRLTLGANNQLNGGVTVSVGVGGTFDTAGFSDTVAGLSGVGTLNTSATPLAGLTVAGSATNLFTGSVTGAGLLRLAGTGSLTLGGTSTTYIGQLSAVAGTLAVSADFSGATATPAGGTLAGTGVVKALPAAGTGTVNPGVPNAPGGGGVLVTVGGTSSLSGQTFRVDLNTLTRSGQLALGAGATIDLANATLRASLIFSTFGDTFPIVTSASGGITGTFAGLPDNSTFALTRRQFRIRYTANAVTLTDLQSVTLTPFTLPAGGAGVAYNQSITSTGGTAPVTLAVSNVVNTTGLTIAGSGTGTITVSGTPTSAGTVTFTVTPSDALGAQAGTDYTVTINPPVSLTPSSLPAGEVGQPYNRAITSTGGTGPVTLAVSGVTNATGLTITGSGTGTVTVSGTPTSAGTVTFTVTPTDNFGAGAPVTYSFAVAPPVALTPATLPAGEVRIAYNQSITSTGGAPPVTLAVSAVTNATGLTISGDGTGTVTISGTSTAAGTVTFTVTPTSAAGTGAGTVYTIAVNPPVALTPAALPFGEVGLSYSRTITASGGSGPITLAVSGVTNATGLTISGSGTGTVTVSGTPTTPGVVTFTVTPTDAVGTGPATVYTFTVAPPVTLTPATLPVGQVGLTYNRPVTATGGVAPITLVVSGVTNATGLTITGSGTGTVTVSGRPTAAGTVSFTVTATDALGGQAVTAYSFAVAPAVTLTPASLPSGEVGFAYGQSVTSSGGAAPVTLAVTGVTNTTGLTFTGINTGTVSLSGVPTSAGVVTFTVTPTSAAGTGTGTVYTVAVAGPVALAPSSLPAGQVGLAYSRTLTPVGGTGPVTLAVSGVTNATGLTITGGGTNAVTVSGTPTASGTVTFTVTPTDSFGAGAPVTYSFAVASPVALTPSALPGATVGTPYNAAVTSTGGAAPVTLAVSGVTNTTGLTITGSGTGTVTLSGTPTSAGTVTFTVTPLGSAGASAGTVYAVAVAAPPAGLVGSALFAVGADAGGPSAVTLYRPDRSIAATLDPFPGYSGGVRTAAADFNGDGVADVVAGTGPGGRTRVRILDGKTGAELFSVDPFEAAFTGGVFVAVGDLTGDGVPDLVITPDEGGGPRVRVFSGKGFAQVADFFGIDDPNFRGGARAGVGDLTGDGVGDLVVAAGFGGGPRVAVFDGTSLSGGAFTRKPFPDFFAFEDTLRNGVYVAAGDLDGDGKAELVAGGGPGGGPRVTAFSGSDLARNVQTRLADFFAGDPAGRGGARVAVKNLDGDRRADLVVGAGANGGSRVTAYAGKSAVGVASPPELFAFDAIPDFRGGVYVG